MFLCRDASLEKRDAWHIASLTKLICSFNRPVQQLLEASGPTTTLQYSRTTQPQSKEGSAVFVRDFEQ